MQPFELDLLDGGKASGRLRFPERTNLPSRMPLIVCMHGGSYDSEYFDADAQHSIFGLATRIGIPVIALDRPGYGKSKVVTVTDETYAEAQGKYINSTILPALWKEFEKRSNAKAIVLLAHSIGAMMATIAAGSYTVDQSYPLAGLITSGIGSQLHEGPREGMKQLLSIETNLINFDAQTKDAIMLQWPMKNVVESTTWQLTEKLNKPIPREELSDINTNWLTYWKKYANNLTVPIMYGSAEFDALWVSSNNAIEEYRQSFSSSPKVECGLIPKAPHCIELSCQSMAWYLRCFGFAMECVVAHTLHVTPS
jgi:pimeloyl-ACP methyl ester carboxylesterase